MAEFEDTAIVVGKKVQARAVDAENQNRSFDSNFRCKLVGGSAALSWPAAHDDVTYSYSL